MAAERFEQTTFAKLISSGALEIGDGYRAKNTELGGTGPIFLRAGHVTDTHIDFAGVERFHEGLRTKVHSKLSKPGDTVVTTKGNSTGRATYVSADMPPFVYSPHLSYWRSRDRECLEGGYLRYWCKSPEFTEQLTGMKASTDMAPYLSLVDQRRLRISLPPISEQRAIGRVLGTLDDKIELNRRMNETLEEMARALFKSWFVDFDPVRAKAEGRDPGLPKHVADLFPDSFEDSEQGEIPVGWGFGHMSDLCEAIYSGGTPSTQEPAYWGGDVPWLSSGETREKFIVATERHITSAGVENSSTRLAPALSTVVASAGQGNTRGQTSLLTFDSYVNQSVVVLQADPHRSSPYHLFFDLERRYDEFRRVSDGQSSRGSLTTKLLAGLAAVLPPRDLIRQFDKLAMVAVRRVVGGLHESDSLAVLRDTLLPRLLKGELRVASLGDSLGGSA